MYHDSEIVIRALNLNANQQIFYFIVVLLFGIDNSDRICLSEALFVVIVILVSVYLRLPDVVKMAAYKTINIKPAIKKYQINVILLFVHFSHDYI
jgi:hypothetical protein